LFTLLALPTFYIFLHRIKGRFGRQVAPEVPSSA
jgi:hypothetical protein